MNYNKYKLKIKGEEPILIQDNNSFDDVVTKAKTMVKDRLALGQRVEVSVYVDDEIDIVIRPIDVEGQTRRDDIRLIDYEIETLKLLFKDYETVGVENSDYYNVYGRTDSRRRRGAISSLTKKGIINHVKAPKYFNPIFPGINIEVVLNKYEEELNVNDNLRKEIRKYE